MLINYKYKQPVERPIEEASFQATGGASCKVSESPYGKSGTSVCEIEIYCGCQQAIASFNCEDLSQFIEVLCRFRNQLRIEGV